MKDGSEQTERRQDPCEERGYERRMDTAFAKPRAVVERSIQKLKRFRRLDSGRIYFRSNMDMIHDLITIAAVCVNMYLRNEIEDDDIRMSDFLSDSDGEGM